MSDQDEIFDAIIVGGGLAGLAAAYTLADAGKDVLLLERGDYCGSKNVTGGRLYVAPIRDLYPEIWDKAPLERPIVTEEICMMSAADSVLVRYDGEKISSEPYQSYSVCRGRFDKYLAKLAARKGASIITKSRVDDLIIENGAVHGVVADGEELRAPITIICEGVLGMLSQKAGLRKPVESSQYAVGVKEVIELDSQTIEERFGLAEGMGAARLFMGDATKGRFGGGFLYTNKTSLSVGLVLGLDQNCDNDMDAPSLLERFKSRRELARLLRGGETVEYSAHVITEAGHAGICKLYGDGVLVAGEAAGFALNGGTVVRGMEYAIASGHYAALSAIRAIDSTDATAHALSAYEHMLNDSFVMKDFIEYKTVPEALDYNRFFTYYPSLMGDLMGDLFAVENGPKQRIYPTIRRHLTSGDLRTIAFRDMRRIKKL